MMTFAKTAWIVGTAALLWPISAVAQSDTVTGATYDASYKLEQPLL